MATEADRKADFEEAYNHAWTGWGTWQLHIKEDLKIYLGDPWNARDRRMFNLQDRTPMSFPMIRRNIKLITGYQRKNRLTLKYDPVEGSDETTASQLTAAAIWALTHGNGNNIMSDAFEGCLKSAMNLVNIYNDRNGDTKFDRFFYNQFLLDPNFSYRDLSDCHFGIMRKHITRDAAKMLLPDREAFIDGLPTDAIGSKFPNYQAPTLYTERLLAYDEFQSRTTKEITIIIDRRTGQETEWKGRKEDLEIILGQYPNLTTLTRRIPTVEVTSYLGGEEVFNGEDAFGIGDFSFTPVIAYWDPEYDRMEDKLQSLVRGQRDFQKANDMRIMAMMAALDQAIGSGLDFEVGSLVDDDDAFVGGNRPRIFTKNALAQNRARDRVRTEIPQSMFQLQQLLNEMMPKSVNINEELLGTTQGNPQIAGFLAQFRAGQALTGLQDLFDNNGLSTKVIGTKLLKLIQQYPASKIQRITNQQPTQEFYKNDFGKYDAVAVEGMETSTQRNRFYTELIQIKEMGNKVGDPAPVPWSLIFKYIPVEIPEELTKQAKQLEQQAQQVNQKQEQMQQTLQQLAIQQAQSQMLENRAQAEERRTQAVENQTGAALDRIKTTVEINDLRNKPIMEALKLAIDIEKIGQQNKEAKVKS